MALGAGCLKALCGACVQSDPGIDTRGSPRRVERGMGDGVWARPLQAMAQVVPLWVRPIASSRRRLSAALRWCSQWSLRVTPR